MANTTSPGTRILTDYRAVAHIVEGISIILFTFLGMFLTGINMWYILTLSYGFFEITKGSVLILGIIKGHRGKIIGYLCSSVITILVQKILIIVFLIYFGSLIHQSYYGLGIGTVIALSVFHFIYEWFLLYHVNLFMKNIPKNEKSLPFIYNQENPGKCSV